MNKLSLLCAAALLLVVPRAAATSFVMPDDDELLAKSSAVVIAMVERASVQVTGHEIETVYDVRVEHALKGGAKTNELIRIVSPGGALKDRGVIVEGAAHFDSGERVLLFLTSDGGRWRTTDMTLGKFRFRTSTTGERLLVRDLDDVVGWDRIGRVHREPIRLEEPFLRFLEDRVAGLPASSTDYFVDPTAVTLELETQDGPVVNGAPFPPGTYTVNLNNQPTRWPSPSVVFRKRVDQNISGVPDGGVSVIQGGLAAWTNECGSNLNLTYGGTTPAVSQNHDGINVVEFNDPQNRVAGSWGGSGTIAIAFTSYSGSHTFAGVTWWNITGADVVFQNGYPGTHASFRTAMTHELGHGIGWRHSNAHFTSSGGADAPCNGAVEECSSNAIMTSVVNSALGYNLQTWDINAAQSVYPGGSCGGCTPPSVTVQPLSQASIPGTVLTLSVSASGTAPLSYQWYRGASGNTSSPVAGATSSTLTFTYTVPAQSFWVRVSNACGSTNSAGAYITPMQTVVRLGGDYNGDGRTDLVVWRNAQWLISYSSGGTASFQWGAASDIPVPGDYDNDNRTDLAVWRPSNGTWFIRYATGATSAVQWGVPGDIPVPADYDGDGDVDLAVFRPGSGYWLIIGPSGGYAVQWGLSGDIPVPADYNGNGSADIAIFRRGTWFIRNISTPSWGQAGDLPIPGDYSGDGVADLAVYRPASGYWLISASTGTFVQQWGLPGDVPVPGDFNGDLRPEIAVWRPFDGNWLIRDAAVPGGAYVRQWGLQGDMPLTD